MKIFCFISVAAMTSFSLLAGNNDVTGDVEEVRFRESESKTITAASSDHLENEQTELHKYYLSVSNVKYSAKAAALQMTSRFFIDDLEDVLNERLDKKMSLGNPDGLADLKPILNRYISKRLNVTIDSKNVEPVVIGAEYDADQIIIYIEMPTAQRPKNVEMSYKALFELFPEQKNLIHFKIADSRKSILNSRDIPQDRVNF